MPVLLPLVPLSQFGRRFFLLVSMISIAFVGLAITAGELAIGHLYLVFAALLIAYNLFLPRQRGVDWSERREEQEGGAHPVLTRIVQALLVIAIPVGVLALVVDALRYTDTVELEFASELLLALNFVSAAVLLGGALAAMILGHWYLVSRKLSFTPLARVTTTLLAVLMFRMAVTCVAIWAQEGLWSEMVQRAGLMSFLLHPGTFLMTRLLFGFIAPLVLLFMVWRCVRIRSNQSATGILYVVVAFVLIGEIIAKYMFVSHRLLI